MLPGTPRRSIRATYVYGAGGYRFSDFIRVGLPLSLLLWGTAMVLIPMIWPF